MTRKTIVFDVSAHGFGHLAQVGPVARRFADRRDVRVIVRSAYSFSVVRDFVGAAVETHELPFEPSLEMDGSLSVDRVATAASYEAFHEYWERNIARRAEELAAFNPDLLIADIPYASLAAASRLSLPAIAMCCYDWRDARRFFGAGLDGIDSAITAAYRSASLFLQPSPHMPMPDLVNRRSIGPIARIGQNRRTELRHHLGVPPGQKLALLTFGGNNDHRAFPLPDEPDIVWIAKDQQSAGRARVVRQDAVPLPFVDMLASVDVVVSKEGYGTMTEAACNGTPLLMLTRPDWPETPYFLAWASHNARFASLPLNSATEHLRQALENLFAMEPRPPLQPTGIDHACEAIAAATGLSIN